MRNHPFLWSLMAVLLAVVLAAGLLVGVGGGEQAAAKEPRATVGKIMIPASAFIPTTDNWDYSNSGYYLTTIGGSGNFSAPLVFPVPVVRIRKITLYAYDNTAGGNICATLFRSQPLTDDEATAGGVCTSDNATDPQVVGTTGIDPRRVNTAVHGPYLWVTIDPNTDFYGVQVVYSY